jgi:peptide/nickel transport system substrate-binding protein
MLRLVSAIEAPDARTVIITLEEPFAPFINSLSFMFIVSPSFVNENSVDDDLGEAYLQNHAAGTGPYMLESWEPGQRIVLVRNPDYWRGWDETRNVERIDALIVNDNNTVRLMLENGDVDIAERVPIDFIDVYKNNPNLQVFVDTTLNLNWVMLNNQMEVTSDPRIRKAIAHAFDRESFINGILLGYGVQSDGPFPPELVGEVPDLPQYTFDLDAARQLLAEAGYPDGGFTLDAFFITGQVEQQRLLELLQANLAQLNINMTISNLTWPVLLGALQELETAKQAYAWALWPNYPDPDAYLSLAFYSGSQGSTGRNLMYYSNPEVDELIIEARMAQDPETRAELYRTAAAKIWEDCPGVLSHRLMYPIAMNKRVEGYEFNAMWVGFVRYYDVHLA